jgi:hypothetical protein
MAGKIRVLRMTRVSGLVSVRPALFEFRVADVLVQPARQALVVLVDDVVGEPPHGTVHAGPLAHQAPVVLRVPAVDKPDHPRSGVPAAVPNPGVHEDQPEAVDEGRAVGLAQAGRYLCRQRRGDPLVSVDEVDPVVPHLR